MILKNYLEYLNENLSDDEIFIKFGAQLDKTYYKENSNTKYYKISHSEEYTKSLFPNCEIPFHLSKSESLNISDCGLTTLIGSPEYVDGTFKCSRNNITSLEGAPLKIKKHFYCVGNNITNLKNFPIIVGEHINISSCLLTSLEGLPEKVEDDLNISNNRIKNLKGCSHIINGAFDAKENSYLTSLEGGPKDVFGAYNLVGCENLISLQHITFSIGHNFYGPSHLITENLFVNENLRSKEINSSNYFIKLLEFVISKNLDADSVNWPDGFLNDNLKKSVRVASKFKL